MTLCIVGNLNLQLQSFDFLLHLWSLAVEIQFYALAPILMVFRQRIGRIIFVPIICLSLWSHIANTGSKSFSFILSRLWQFFIGSIAYEIEKNCSGQLADSLTEKKDVLNLLMDESQQKSSSNQDGRNFTFFVEYFKLFHFFISTLNIFILLQLQTSL